MWPTCTNPPISLAFQSSDYQQAEVFTNICLSWILNFSMTVVENFESSGYKSQSDRKCVFSWCRSPNHSRCGQNLSLVCQSFPKQQQQIWSFLNIFPIQGSKILYHKWTESNPKAIIGPQGIYLAFDLFSCQKYINPTRRENKMQYHTHPSLIIELIERTKFDIHPEGQSLQHSSKSCQIK